MYNTEVMIEAGRLTMEQNADKDITLRDFEELRAAGGDQWESMERAFLFGVALGCRLTAAQILERRVRE